MMKYTKDHEWLSIEDNTATIGITEHATEQLGDIVFVELPEVGASFNQGDTAATVESVKAASDVYAPVSGEITEANQDIIDDPAIVNQDPTGKGWFYKIKMTDVGEADDLMNEDAYKAMIE